MTTKERILRRRHTEAARIPGSRPVRYLVRFKVGNQRFTIADKHTPAEAAWYRDMLAKAIANLK